jgi:transposase
MKIGQSHNLSLFPFLLTNMRIKVSNDSVPNGGFWYVLDNNSNSTSTISDLQRDLNNILHLSKNPSRISLSLDNFSLLPESPISGLIRDGDLIQ